MVLTLGDRGYHVGLLKAFLNNVREETPGTDIPELSADWVFDENLKIAVLRFQDFVSIKPTGIWDDVYYQTYLALFDGNKPTTRALLKRDGEVADLGTVTVEAQAPSSDAGSAWSSPAQVKAEVAQKQAQNDRGKYPNGQTEAHSRITRLPSSADDKFGDTSSEIDLMAKSVRLLKVELWPFHDQGAKVVFYGIPEEITDTNQNNFTAIAVKGRSAPFQDYENSGPRKLNFNILLHMEYCPGRKILPVVNTIRSYTYPRKQGNIKPIVCNFFVGPTHVKVIIDNVQVTWKKPIVEGWYSMAEVTINMTEVVPNSILYDQVKQQQRFK